MAKENTDISRSTRMIYVWETVKALGRAAPEDIFKKVAAKMMTDAEDKYLRRNIYRDLKSLADSGDIGVEYFTPDGSRIEPGEEEGFKNLRVEYFFHGEEGQIPGGGLVTQSGGIFLPQQRPIIHWTISDLGLGHSKDNISIIFDPGNDRYIAINCQIDEAPFKLVFGRNTDTLEIKDYLGEIEKYLGQRACSLLFGNRSLSRPVVGQKLGHAQIVVNDESTQIELNDIGSSSGTFWAKATPEEVQKVVNSAKDDMTVALQANPLKVEQKWEKVGREPTPVALPVFLKLGTQPILIARL